MPTTTASPNRLPLVLGALVLVVGAGIIAVVASGGGDDDAGAGGSGGTAVTVDGERTSFFDGGALPAVDVEGDDLPELSDPNNDPAVGTAAPVVSGIGLAGDRVSFGAPGRPTIVVFLAHWCPHCQREVPLIQEWVDAGNLPEGVELVAVLTSVDPSLPNFPPDEWLDREGWSEATVIDGDQTAAFAYGLSAFPFFTAVDADGVVVARASGELSAEALTEIARSLSE